MSGLRPEEQATNVPSDLPQPLVHHSTSLLLSVENSTLVESLRCSSSTHTSIIPSRDSVRLYSKTYSFYQSQWKFNNLLPEIMSIILSFLSYISMRSETSSEQSKPNTISNYFFPLDETIQNVRLSCRNWNETILLDHNSQLQQYYLHNKNIFEQHFLQQFPIQIKMPNMVIPTVTSDGRNIFTECLPSLIENKTIIKTFYVSKMESKRMKRNMIYLLQSTGYPHWILTATSMYLCLMLFFAMLVVQDVFISIFGSIIADTFIRYFYNICFVPLYFIFVIFLFIILALNIVDACQDFRKCNDVLLFAFLSFGVTGPFCGFVVSTIFMIQLNIGILPLYSTPSQFGRTEMIPWPVVFIPWYILLVCLSLLFCGFSMYSCKLNLHKKLNKKGIYELCVMTFMFIVTLCCLFLVIWISIALEFPSVIASVYLFIPAYVMELILFVYILLNIVIEVKQISDFKWSSKRWQRTLCLLGFVFGMVLNHILCSLSWYHWIPLAVAYIEVMFPLTCFYAWTIMLLNSQTTHNTTYKAYIKPTRNYSHELRDGSWVDNLKQSFW